MGDSKIEYVTKTWNVVTGCSPVSAGCGACWARAYHARWKKDFTPTFHPEKLAEPLHWRKPQRVAVAFLGDIFHEQITDKQIATVFGVMAACSQHTFLLTTKRAARMRKWFAWLEEAAVTARDAVPEEHTWRRAHVLHAAAVRAGCDLTTWATTFDLEKRGWPLPNVWPGVSVENQSAADERLLDLMATSAAHRWVSLEPCLGPVDLDVVPCRACNHPGNIIMAMDADGRCSRCHGRRFEWPDFVVVGGESSQGGQPARRCDVAWIRAVVEQCRAAGVPVYVKQCGSHVRDRNDVGFSAEDEVFADGPDAGRPTEPQAWPTPADVEHDPDGYRQAYQGAPVRVRLRHPRGADPEEWPEDIRCRELPAGIATEAKP